MTGPIRQGSAAARAAGRFFLHRGRAVLVAGATLALAAPGSRPDAAELYRIDQRYGTVGFSVGILGMFDVEGRFPRFAGDLYLDTQQPGRSHIDVSVDAASIEMPLPEQVELLRSDGYFDTIHHPTERFFSTSVEALSPTHYRIHGMLQLRGVTKSQDLDAELTGRRLDADRRTEVADFHVSGRVSRSAFGMVADQRLVSDTIRLDIRIRLTVGLATNSE